MRQVLGLHFAAGGGEAERRRAAGGGSSPMLGGKLDYCSKSRRPGRARPTARDQTMADDVQASQRYLL